MSSSTTSPLPPSGVPNTPSPALPHTAASDKTALLAKRLQEKKEELRAANARIHDLNATNQDLNERLTDLKYQLEEFSDAALLGVDSTGAIRDDPKPLNARGPTGNQMAPTKPPKSSNAGVLSKVKGKLGVNANFNDPDGWTDVVSKNQKNGSHQLKAPASNSGGQTQTTGFGVLLEGVGHPIEGVYRKRQMQMTSSDKRAVPIDEEARTGPQPPPNPSLPSMQKKQPGQNFQSEAVQARPKGKTRQERLRAADAEHAARIAAAPPIPIECKPEPDITFHRPQQAQIEEQASSSKSKSETDQPKGTDNKAITAEGMEAIKHEDEAKAQSSLPPKHSGTSTLALPKPVPPKVKRKRRLRAFDLRPPSISTPATSQPVVEDNGSGKVLNGSEGSSPKPESKRRR